MTTILNCGTVRFIDIPEWFVARYDDEINAWAANIRKIGLVKSFILKEGQYADVSPDPEQGPVLLQVKLMVKPWSGGVEIVPFREIDRELIAKHVEKMERNRVSPRMILPEPLRPGLPFVPRIVPPEKETH
jgi:hypothetical protein